MPSPDDFRLTVTRTIKAPRDRVFRAWTDPGELARWFHPDPSFTTPVAEVDLRAGGGYQFVMQPPTGDPYVVRGVYREVQPPGRLVFTWRWDAAGDADPETLVTVELHERGGETEVVLTHELLASADSREHHREGWEGCLTQLSLAVQST